MFPKSNLAEATVGRDLGQIIDNSFETFSRDPNCKAICPSGFASLKMTRGRATPIPRTALSPTLLRREPPTTGSPLPEGAFDARPPMREICTMRKGWPLIRRLRRHLPPREGI